MQMTEGKLVYSTAALAVVAVFGLIVYQKVQGNTKQAEHLNTQNTSGEQVDSKITYYEPPPTTINLPPGERFVSIVDEKNQERWGKALRNPLFITEPMVGHEPRSLRIIGPGRSIHSWEILYYIQEHKEH